MFQPKSPNYSKNSLPGRLTGKVVSWLHRSQKMVRDGVDTNGTYTTCRFGTLSILPLNDTQRDVPWFLFVKFEGKKSNLVSKTLKVDERVHHERVALLILNNFGYIVFYVI